jgi:hypothetical protein
MCWYILGGKDPANIANYYAIDVNGVSHTINIGDGYYPSVNAVGSVLTKYIHTNSKLYIAC